MKARRLRIGPGERKLDETSLATLPTHSSMFAAVTLTLAGEIPWSGGESRRCRRRHTRPGSPRPPRRAAGCPSCRTTGRRWPGREPDEYRGRSRLDRRSVPRPRRSGLRRPRPPKTACRGREIARSRRSLRAPASCGFMEKGEGVGGLRVPGAAVLTSPTYVQRDQVVLCRRPNDFGDAVDGHEVERTGPVTREGALPDGKLTTPLRRSPGSSR